MTLLRRLAAWLGLTARGARVRVAVVEECEARILYSADLNPALWAGQADPAQPSAIVGVLNPQAAATSLEAASRDAQAANQRRHEIVFVDAAVPDAQKVIDGLLASRPAGTQVEVVMLQAGSDGLSQIGDVLVHERDIDALHIVSHGAGGFLRLGNATIGLDALQARDAELRGWREALSADADLLLYGCDVGAGDDGAAFVARLASATGADVGASTDDTGSAARGGDWVLERASGPIESGPVVFADSNPFAQWDGLLATFVVSNTNDSGVGSLRQAIIDANALAGADTISFSIGGGGAQTISLTAALPQITGQVTLDGWTQGGFVGTPLVRVDGTLAGASADGIYFANGSDNSIVRGLVITKFTRDGIFVASGADGITIAGNWIGTSGTGSTGVGNGDDGIDIAGSNAIIGGTGANDRNVITNNADEGINIAGSGVTGHLIQGNYIGVDPDGATGGGNTDVGLAIISGSGNTIGGTSAAARNVISRNWEGMEINTSNNVVQGNYIGTDASGALNRGNRLGDGVQVQGSSTNNLIGGSAVGAGNLIAYNAGNGVNVVNGSGDAVLGNTIHANTLLGINLDTAGVTGNDVPANMDLDTGANNLQNFPLLTSAQMVSTTQLQVVGTFNSTANSFFRIEFFGSAAQDGTGHGEGQTYLGFVNVTTNGSGNASFNTTLTAAVATGSYVSATATKSNAAFTAFTDTSEFALNVVTINNAPVLDASKSPALSAVNEDAGVPAGAVGTLVSSLVDFASPSGQVDNVTDADSGALLGIAVTAADTANGSWFHTTDGGTNWNALGAVSNANARLLAADANTRLYFLANANYNGTLANAITFRAWDQTSGTNGGTSSTTSNGGTTGFSIVTDTASLVVNPVADTPAVTNASTNEDTQSTSGLVISRNVADGTEVTNFKITGITNGTLYKNDGTTQITNGTFITSAEGNAGLKFTPAANFNGSGSLTIQASTSNVDAGLGGSTVVATITVNAVNDAPTGAPVVTGTPTEDQTLTANTGTIADGDGLGAFSYQWQRNGVNIGGATASTYTLGDADVGTNIRVVVSYTDGNGTAEALTSAAVGPVANVNDAPTGTPAVTGTPTEDQVLTANSGTIADADGLGAFGYQWQRNGVNIASATASTYTLGDADVGTNIRVVVSYTDARGTAESLTSAAVGPIANVNDAPTGAPLVTGTPTEDQVLSVNTASIADADGLGAFSYQWQRNGANIAGASGSAFTLGDTDVGTNIRVIVSYTDGNGSAESVTSTAVGPVANVNDVPAGAPVVTGIPTEDQLLTASTGTIADADGLGAFSYQWQRNGVNIVGASGSTYTLGDADVGTNIRVVVSYADGNGTAESLASAAVGPVANINDVPVAADDRLALNFDGVDDYVTITNSPSLVMSSTMTLEAWINPDLSSNAVQIIANKEGEYELAVFADGSLNFAFAEGGVWNWRNTGATVARNTWTHVAVTYNAGTVSTYVNGVLVDSQTLATTTIGDVYPALNELRIGGRSNNPANQYFDGRIAEVRVWDVVRSPAQIAGAMNGPLTGAQAGLAGYWALNENSGATVADGTANGNTGTLVNGATWTGYRIDEDTTLTAAVPGVLANDYDADGNALTAVVVSGPANGSLTLNANGSFTYTPTANWHGTDSFTYKANDGAADSNVATVSVVVNSVDDAPTGAPAVTGTPTEDQVLSVSTGTIADGDGLGAFSYQWQRNGVNVAGATASTFVLGEIDVGTNIRVVVSYTDGEGAAESLTSAAVGPVANVNDAPTGAPVVTGIPTEDQTLTADTVTIADADGLGAFAYQWQRGGVNIAGANSSTYVLGDADVGTNIRVVVSYTDGNGTAESLTSAAVGPVANVDDAPTGAPVVSGTPTEGQTLTANTGTIADADGLGAFSYQWQRNGANLVGAIGSTYTLGGADVGANIRVVVSYTDGNGTAESLTSAAVGPVANVNDAPTGAPVVTGTATEDQVLTANTGTIADADGLGAFGYQWQRNGANIGGATASTYTLGDADVGANIRVLVSYTDGNGTAEGLFSAAVGPVANVNDALTGAPVVTGTPTEDQVLIANTGTIADTDGLGAFSYQWQRNGFDVAGATASTYTLGDTDVGTNIRVVVSYTDGNGTAESLTSAAVGPVANVNDAPSGVPVVTGTTTEDRTLTANTSAIADADGLGAISYQWQRNGTNIVGATGGTFTLGNADVGANIRVVVGYIDGNGAAESLTSAAVGPIANVNDAPTGAPVVTGTATEDQTLTADTSAIADADGLGALSYQWQRDSLNIAGATGTTFTLGDADVGANIRVVVSYIDGNGTAESLTSAAVGPITNINDAASGAPIIVGTTTEDQTLTADTSAIADADGLGALSYQWQRNGANILGATAASYVLGVIDVGANMRVIVAYTDGNGTAESLTSAAVGPVANLNDAPVISSNGGAATASLNGNENQVAVTTVTSIDSDGGAPAYSIVGGADAARFTIDSASGALSFVAAPDFEAPLDANADNVYDVTVQVWDGAASDTQILAITIAGVNEAPTGITPPTAAIAESAAAGTLVATVRAVDADAGDLFSFSLVSDAAGRFAIDAASGRIVVAPGAVLDFETQANIDLVVRVTDAAGLSIERRLTVALRDVAEGVGPAAPPPPVVTPPDPWVPAPTAPESPRDNAASAAAPAPAPRGGGTTLPAAAAGESVRTSADTAPGSGIDLRSASPDAPPWAQLREREGVEALVVTVDLNGVDYGSGPSAPIGVALRQMSYALRNANVEAQSADTGAVDERRAPSTLLAFAQDPVRVASLGFTAGFVWWLTRSGGLLTSMLMGVPAWRHLDLLPVVARRRDDDDDLGLDSELDSRPADDAEDSALLDLFEAQPIPHQARSSL